jgi:magnesium chelatase family protein
MGAKLSSILDAGFSGTIVDIECHMSNSLPGIVIVGFANKAVDEAKERIRGAFSSSNIPLPKKRIAINLAPADIPKDNTSLDLAMSCSILITGGLIKDFPSNAITIGELGLEGKIRGVRGIVGKLLAGKKAGYTNYVIPSGNLRQAMLVPGLKLLPFDTLKQLYDHCNGLKSIKPVTSGADADIDSVQISAEIDFQDIVGQTIAKRAAEIAAAGNHNLLLNGPPGTGKSMLAKALIGIIPPMANDEMLETTHLHSLNSANYEQIIRVRPFRSPHHSSSDAAIIGGGKNPRPGEISLSHNGILFFDELPEFKRTALEALRQPLEDRTITVSRSKETLNFPANFLFIATANPCPCGFYGTDKTCTCTASELSRYQRKLSGPILDRIDIYADVDNTPHDKLLRDNFDTEKSSDVAVRVTLARKLQQERYRSTSKTNSMMSNRDVKKYANLTPQAEALLNQAATKLGLSARGYMRTVKVARTIADLDGSDKIDVQHSAEALQLRPKRTVLL